MSELTNMIDAYVECALWSSTDDDGTPMDGVDADLDSSTLDSMGEDCVNFLAYCADIGIEWAGAVAPEQMGHDFWLTRNRHGAGFWDRGLGDLGDQLTKAAHTFGSCDLYRGDDGRIYAC